MNKKKNQIEIAAEIMMNLAVNPEVAYIAIPVKEELEIKDAPLQIAGMAAIA